MNTHHTVWRDGLRAGMLAGGLSLAMMALRGRFENGAAASALNAPSHWVWGDEALRRDGWSWRHTALGIAIHQGSALWWGVCHRLRESTGRPFQDATVTTAAAAMVDLVLVPERLTPGFERRLKPAGLLCVYAAFALGLALAGRGQRRRSPSRR